MQFLIRIIRFLGMTNAMYDEKHVPKIAAKVNRRNAANYYFNFLAVLMVIVFGLSFFVAREKNDNWIILLSSVGLFLTMGAIFIIRLKEGDTIIADDDGIEEINWLFSKSLRWDEIRRVRIYTEGKFSKKYKKLSLLKAPWFRIKIEAGNKKIFVSNRYSNLDELVEYLLVKCRDKIEERKYEPIYRDLIIWVILIMSLLSFFVVKGSR